MVRSHERVTRLSRTGESSKVETEDEEDEVEDEDRPEPLTAETISETAWVCAGSESTGAVLASEATSDADPEGTDGDVSVRRWSADE
jgi:hypothetical protein